MSVKIIHDNYGKSRVRLMKVERRGAIHEIQNITVKIALEGDFDEIHTVGDNSKCLPTDTMKNTVYALASQTQEIEEIETFAMRLTKHFLTNNPQIERVIIEVDEHGWTRMNVSGEPHEHSFTKGTNEKRTAKISATRENTTVESGIEDLIVLKTTKSGFVGFIKDQYTTLPETTDRIFCTSVKAVWRYNDPESATGDVWRDIRQHDHRNFCRTRQSFGSAHALCDGRSRFGKISRNCGNRFLVAEYSYFARRFGAFGFGK